MGPSAPFPPRPHADAPALPDFGRSAGMTALVTGGLGFIGQGVCTQLLAAGWQVKVMDRQSDFYDPSIKEHRAEVLAAAGANVVIGDVTAMDDPMVLHGVDVVFHLAGQPGVRQSWGPAFATYARDNVLATQRLLELAEAAGTRRVVYASSSSIYGEGHAHPAREADLPAPVSPYGITKLAGEHLLRAYSARAGIETAILRYFTVYGPEQRPDMAFHRLIDAALTGSPFTVNGTGRQLRDFTFVDDIVDATILAGTVPLDGNVTCNIAGGSSISLLEAIDAVGELVGTPVDVRRDAPQAGDVTRTEADTALARQLLGWQPTVAIAEGLQRQVDWQRQKAGARAAVARVGP